MISSHGVDGWSEISTILGVCCIRLGSGFIGLGATGISANESESESDSVEPEEFEESDVEVNDEETSSSESESELEWDAVFLSSKTPKPRF